MDKVQTDRDEGPLVSELAQGSQDTKVVPCIYSKETSEAIIRKSCQVPRFAHFPRLVISDGSFALVLIMIPEFSSSDYFVF